LTLTFTQTSTAYLFTAQLTASMPATPDFKYDWTDTGNGSFVIGCVVLQGTGVEGTFQSTDATDVTITGSANEESSIICTGIYNSGTTPGSLAFRFAAQSAGTVTLRAGSHLRAEEDL
jgi:hypothetical protein